uniref:Tetratricopeptide repeat domain 12 n=1 Tax=Molossus molossus TaxID=27622 RepID=A0A7J8EVK1_MOLMO|nr:tetratricopeptide repeat domain 12 [Molossus molossus]
MADDQEKDLQKFLKNVDEITSLIQEMNSEDPAVRDNAVLRTERRLLLTEEDWDEDRCRAASDRTVINPAHAPAEGCGSCADNADEVNTEAFLASVEKDAKERAKRRRENRVLADALKEKGNEAFARGAYETAVLCYSEGLEKLKDMKAYMKLGDYQKALVDCDWALKCDEKCTKAYLHMGKAHLALKNYGVSRECFEKIIEINPQLQTQMKDYLNQVDLREKADHQEKEAQERLDLGRSTAVTTRSLLETLSKPQQNPLFYAGGIEILTEMMKDCTERTLFRTLNGFNVIGGNEVIQRCFSTAALDGAEETLCVAVLRLWQAVCSENEENRRVLVLHPDAGRLLPSLLASGALSLRQQSLALLLQLVQTGDGRSLVVSHLDLTRLLEALVSFLDFPDKTATSAMGLLTDLALEERFQVWFPAHLAGVLPAFTGVLRRDPKVTNTSALSQCVAVMGNLSADAATRRQMSASEEFGGACLDLMRAAGVLSRTLPSSQKAVEEAMRTGVVKKMMKFLKTGGQTASRYAVKTLAVCTNSNHEAREEVVRLDKKFSVLRALLSSEDESLAGNAALCLGSCMEVPQAAAALLRTDIVQVLLRLAARDAQKSAVQLNAGIALGKLCTAEPRFAAQLRELQGFEILSSAARRSQDP